MSNWRFWAFGLAMLTLGYLAGTSGVSRPLVAQEAGGVGEGTANKIRTAGRALRDAMEALQSEGRYESITQGPNAFLILGGGGNAREDLESGRGVDPETFAGLYSNQAIPEFADQLDRDEQGRVTFNGEVVRMYARSRLERVFAERTKINDVGQ